VLFNADEMAVFKSVRLTERLQKATTPSLHGLFGRGLIVLSLRLMLALSLGLGIARAAEANLLPTAPSIGDGQFTQLSVAGEQVWQNTGTSTYLYFKRPTNAFAFTAGQTLYVRATYYDGEGGGRINLQYDGQTSAYTTSLIHERTSRVGSGRFVDAYYELTGVLLSKRQNGGADLRLICGAPGGVPISVSSVVLSDVPFDNAEFQLAISRPWSSRYTGPARDEVDPTSLKGKVMTGYQGWFRMPNDSNDNGWSHWIRGQTMASQHYTIDMWPDLTEYDPASLVRAGNISTTSGAPAYLFSSTNYSVVHQHFRWMRKHNIDGAWLQRFNWGAGTQPEWVIRNVSQAAAAEGRVWGLEYDVSGKSSATVFAEIQADLQWLTTEFDIFNDPRYVREDGKPAIFIWGLPFPDRNITVEAADSVVDWLKAQNLHVIGGIPNSWSGLNSSWQNHIAKYDGVLVWMSTKNSNSTRIAEMNTFKNRGQDYYPHVWPGFSWAHLKQHSASSTEYNSQYTARSGGQFYWDKGRRWVAAGADRMFIGMFDEYDEGTAIMPMTDDAPNPHTDYGRFINNEEKPGDWWMTLTDELKRMLLNQRTNTGTLPSVASLANRSNIGPEAMVDLGTIDDDNLLSCFYFNGDGKNLVEVVGGKECRSNLVPATDRYMYFGVDDSFAYQMTNGDVTIEVEYFDSFNGTDSGTVLGLQYDGSGNIASPNYTTHPQSITTTDSNTWRTVRFEIADAYFGDRQNMEADFRLNFSGKKLHVNRVWVRLPEGKAHPFTWTNATSGTSINWAPNANWLGGIVAQPDPTSTVRFFTDQTLAGGTVSISNNVGSQVFNRVELDGNASPSAATTITLTGQALSLQGNTPEIALHANIAAYGLSYDLQLPLTLSTQTLLSGDGDANFRISGIISGTGGLIKTGASTLILTGSNTFSGGVTIQNGTMESRTTQTTLGSGTVTMGGSDSNGVTYLTGQDNSNRFVINAPDSGNIVIGTNGGANGFTLSGGITLNNDLTLQTFDNVISGSTVASVGITGGVTGTGNLLLKNLGTAANTITVSGSNVNHTGSLTLEGTASGTTTIASNIGSNVTDITQNSLTSLMILNGQNSYHGDTTVNAGTLRISQAVAPNNANPSNDASTVSIAQTGATLNLTYQGTDKVDQLLIGYVRKANGVYGKIGSTAPVIGISQITGDGTLTVSEIPQFSSWIAGTFANGVVANQGPLDDDDNDGIPNLIEFALGGLDPTVSNASTSTIANGVFSFAKRADVAGITYAIEESTDLGVSDAWQEVSGESYINGAEIISYAPSPGAADKNFVRLKISMNP
jgi:autotransporter-associated beta strand protein